MRAALLPLLLLAACDDDTAAINDDLRTLDNCETTVADDVPAFFQELYRCVDVALADDEVAIATVNLPPHTSPYYPTNDPNYEAFDDRGGTHFQNPNVLAEQAMTITVPVEPTAKGITITDDMVDLSAGTSDEEYPGGNGVSLDGTVIFAAMAAPGDDITQEDQTFDTWEAHPEGTGVYHHHGPNPAALTVLEALGMVTTTTPGEAEVEVYGIMCDGTVLLGCTEADGSAVDTADLDAQNGHLHDIVAASGTWFTDRYHTHVCTAFGHAYMPEIQYYEGCATPRP